ncbi:MAG TPA: hypothetical protein VFM93_05945, partial [Candidatus Limnocylindria bacterium]|nr:hypothetical protein [Candidatus Limnocylindria bacterium]
MRAAPFLAVLVLVLAACSNTPPAALPTGEPPAGSAPLDAAALAFDSDRTGNFEIFVARVDGSQLRQLTADAAYDSWWARIAPDRRRILFYRTPKGTHDRDYTKTSLWMMNADGTDQRHLLPAGGNGWDMHGHAEWSPEGDRLVMFGGQRMNPQIFVTDLRGGSPRAITARGGQNLDPSWSPDGERIVFVGCPAAICFERDYEVYVVPAAGGEAARLTENGLRDHDPYYSPDGRSIAWLQQTDTAGPVGVWNIRLMLSDGSQQRAVTNDRHINSKPEWSRDGAAIFFHRFEAGGDRWRLFTV